MRGRSEDTGSSANDFLPPLRCFGVDAPCANSGRGLSLWSGFPAGQMMARIARVTGTMAMPLYKVMVDDNFHYQDEGERYEDGAFDTLEAAVARCRAIVDEWLRDNVTPGMTADKLYEQYQHFGEDPVVVAVDGSGPLVPFSAWDYARARCAAVCDENPPG